MAPSFPAPPPVNTMIGTEIIINPGSSDQIVQAKVITLSGPLLATILATIASDSTYSTAHAIGFDAENNCFYVSEFAP